MSDENKNEQEEQVEIPETTPGDGASGGKSYSQEQLDRMFADRAKQAEAAAFKKLGFTSYEEAETLVKKARELEEANKTELQKANERAEALEKQLADAAQAQKTMATQNEIANTAVKLGIVDPDAAYKLLDKGAIEYGEDGKPKNVEALLQGLLKDKPYLGGGGPSPMNQGRKRTFSREEIEKMSPDEINKNWDDVKKFLERPR